MIFKRYRIFAASAALLLALAAPAFAGPFSVAVSARGADAASCGTVASPCRTLQYAHNRVDPNGKIDVLGSGDYGALSITKSVNIVYDGAGVALLRPSAAGRNAVVIAAAAADVVRLKGLTIDGGGTGLDGVNFMSGARLDIANCAIRNTTRQGMTVTSAASAFSIVDSNISNNGYGVRVRPVSGAIKGEIDNLHLSGNTLGGLLVENASEVVVRNSVAMSHRGTPGVGFRASGAGARLTLSETTALDNALGVSAVGAAVLRLSKSIVIGNGVAAAVQAGGVVETFGDNVIRTNGNDALGALTPVQNR